MCGDIQIVQVTLSLCEYRKLSSRHEENLIKRKRQNSTKKERVPLVNCSTPTKTHSVNLIRIN